MAGVREPSESERHDSGVHKLTDLVQYQQGFVVSRTLIKKGAALPHHDIKNTLYTKNLPLYAM
jgi:hypothetical protein